MKNILIFVLLLFPVLLKAQATAIDSVIVEKYYISDTNDATDTIYNYDISGAPIGLATPYFLDTGSITYRVYIDLKPGYKLIKIYGDANHTLKIMSDSVFFNHAQGKSFGSLINKTTLFKSYPTSALDTWLTLEMATTKYPGVLKADDPSGTFLGGSINSPGDGFNANGFLNSTNPAAGIPLLTKDGLALAVSPITLNPTDTLLTADSTSIFGTKVIGKEFISNKASLQYGAGVQGTTPDNRVLVAQLTTKGKISFELNIEVLDTAGVKTNYIASGRTNSSAPHHNDTLLSTYLTYPPPCGCRDPNYLEYNARFACDDGVSCKTPIVFGCMDTLACNYDKKANYNLQNLCCYPGYCNDRNISLVCPGISNASDFILYPNPAQDQLNLQFTTGGTDNKEIKYSIYDSYGVLMLQKSMGLFSGIITQPVDISNLKIGLYMVRVSIGDITESKLFMKN